MLHSDTLGTGPDLIILHGLFGSGDNWRSIAKGLSEHYRVHLLDLPNHGRSPWIDRQSYPAFAEAVMEWLRDKGIERYHLMGHSMGGKVAMQMALGDLGAGIDRLIVVDIAPRAYPPHHQDIFGALNRIDLSQHKDRRSVDEALKDGIETAGIRQFILKSLYRNDKGELAWRFNLKALQDQYEDIAGEPDFKAPFEGPTLFIKGMNSQYITAEDQPAIRDRFPNAEAKLIEGAGHWPHAEKPAAFQRIIERFLAGG
ncbi:alpha/beta fold hydrolase [Saccharospirillum salsuginis]|uniref:Acyl-CoA esterase n=1 Tax=Saccharospirillum salsuginis TaxID=418750 RepID=A0A918NIF5_9GAMM|nr:alpha/beta fold hydrolase [Saccharospirillum salsuginis]GGX69735.1 acyl-CoA esterase [Saccharospirillum salsuginis]